MSLTLSIAIQLLFLPFEHARTLPLQAPHRIPQLGKFGKQSHDLYPFVMRRRRDTAGKHGAGRHGLGDSGLRTDHRAIADFNMIDHAYLSSQGHVSPPTRATRNSGLRRDHRILAHRHIVGDLHQIVDFDAALNHGSSDRAAIYRSVRTDFNVVFHDDDPSLGNLDTLSAAARIAESIATD